ncbi:hypothetical protein ACHEXK_10245 [Limnohabitans sp. DCL3]|uniref:hypothetical protein n=1 Tax=Limnohabitans sp. DCL3 TaxID=3374103 RepID=UPI003A87E1E3
MNYFYLTGTPVTTSDRDKQISTFIPLKFAKRSGRSVVTTVEDAMKVTATHEPLPDTTLMNALAKAFHWQRLLDRGIVHSGTEIAQKENMDLATVNEILRLTLLDPEIVEGILRGRQPEGLTMNWLNTNPIPWEWKKQRDKIQNIARNPA